MSTKLTGYVWDGCSASGMKLSIVAIIASLADFSNDEGVCWPSIATIAQQIGAGESTVRTAITVLEKYSCLTRKQRRQGNRNASKVYKLNVKKLQAAAFSHLSYSDPSKFEASKSSTNDGFDSSESGGDPSVNSKPLCQVSTKPYPEVLNTDNVKHVLAHLNQKTGSRYQVSKTSLNHGIHISFTTKITGCGQQWCTRKLVDHGLLKSLGDAA